ncbi:MAG: hypothetical protein ABUS57_03870 [Pseudomonadota bacterium]
MNPRKTLAVAAALALAACGQPASTTSTSTAPQSLMEQAQAKSPEDLPMYGWQLLTAYQSAHPDSTPVCHSVRETASRGVIPANADPASIYGAHTGALAISVQCGPQLTGTPMDPKEHWLVILAPGATEAQIVSCADAKGKDICPNPIPTAAAAATTTATATSSATKAP